MIFTHEITLDVTINQIKTLNIKQYTKGSFKLHVNLTDRSEPFKANKNTQHCYFKMETPDKKHIFTDATINDDGSVDISIPEKACLAAGSGTAELVFKEQAQERIFATMNLNVNIIPSAYHNSHITSSDDFDALQQALFAADKTYNQVMESAAASALLAQSYAKGDTNSRENEETDNARHYKEEAEKAKNTAADYSSAAQSSADTASTKAGESANSATSAAASADTAATKANESAEHAKTSRSYAIGDTDLRENEENDCAKHYYEQAQYYCNLAQDVKDSLGSALRPMGTRTFANLPALADVEAGDMYNVSDQFTTNGNFEDGSDITVPAGSNVYKTVGGKWDVLAGSPVTGIKGNAEISYRKGNVNITPENIGAPSMEYMNEHFVGDYVSKHHGVISSKGWHRIAQASNAEYGASCVVSIKRGYYSPAPEYQKVQLVDSYKSNKLLPIVSFTGSDGNHLFTKIRKTWDARNSMAYIEIYQRADTNTNSVLVTVEDALCVYGGPWKAITPTLTEETVSGITVQAAIDLPADFAPSHNVMDTDNNNNITLSYHKPGLNSADWLTAWNGYELRAIAPSKITGVGSAVKATQDSDGNVIKDTYLPAALMNGQSLSIGYSAYANANGSLALPCQVRANSVRSVALGWGSHTDGEYSTAVGASAHASGTNSVALGVNANANGSSSITLGSIAKSNADFAITVGAGTLVNAARGTAVGSAARALAQNASAFGYLANASAFGATALGFYSNANGYSSAALGRSSETNGYHATALGFNTTASANNATALGQSSRATSIGSTALGNYAVTSNANSIQLGNASSLSSITSKVAITVTSDERDKADITEMEDGALKFLSKVTPIRYVFNGRELYIDEDDLPDEERSKKEKYGLCAYDRTEHNKGTKKGSRIRVGVSAQNVQQALEAIYGNESYANLVNNNLFDFDPIEIPEGVESQLAVNYEGFIPFLIKAVQELAAKVEQLQGKEDA